jgi:bifunctional non-homologous end joining protein LigD
MDGYRLQTVKDGSKVRLYSRGGHEWTKRLAALAGALTAIPQRSVIIDAELCCAGADGAPDFTCLPAAMCGCRQHELSAFAFDLLHRSGV